MTPYYDEDGITIFHADCRELLHTFNVAAVVTDPPYDKRTHEGARNHGEDFSRIDFAPLDVMAQLPAILETASRWVLCFCTMEMIAEYQAVSGEAWIRAGFWRRPDGAPQFTGDRPATAGDALAIMHRTGKKRWNGGGRHAYWEYGVEREDRAHPTQKPLGLMSHLIRDFTDSGETILDPFMGSGTTLRAAKDCRRKAIGIEIDERYCEIAANRLRQRVLPLEMADGR